MNEYALARRYRRNYEMVQHQLDVARKRIEELETVGKLYTADDIALAYKHGYEDAVAELTGISK